MKVGTVQKSR